MVSRVHLILSVLTVLRRSVDLLGTVLNCLSHFFSGAGGKVLKVDGSYLPSRRGQFTIRPVSIPRNWETIL